MDRRKLESMFNETESEFTGEEITTYKRYIEENNVYTENNFEFIESNLSYYSSRYTSEHYSSPSEMLHCNSNFLESDEMKQNIHLYLKSIEWFSKTVHPEDSEYVIKKEKYIYTQELGGIYKEIIDFLNNYSMADYQCIDLLFYSQGVIYKYLPYKNFVIKWRNDCETLENDLIDNNFYQTLHEYDKEELKDSLIIIPIFIPIRKVMFLGEYGYRSALITYGQVIERIISFLKDTGNVIHLEMFDHFSVNNLLGLDGVEKSICNLIIYKERGKVSD